MSKRPCSNTNPYTGWSLQQDGDGVGELDLAAHARLRAVEGVEDLGCEHVAADHGQVGGGVLGLGLLDDAPQPHKPVVGGLGVDTAVGRDLLDREPT